MGATAGWGELISEDRVAPPCLPSLLSTLRPGALCLSPSDTLGGGGKRRKKESSRKDLLPGATLNVRGTYYWSFGMKKGRKEEREESSFPFFSYDSHKWDQKVGNKNRISIFISFLSILFFLSFFLFFFFFLQSFLFSFSLFLRQHWTLPYIAA